MLGGIGRVDRVEVDAGDAVGVDLADVAHAEMRHLSLVVGVLGKDTADEQRGRVDVDAEPEAAHRGFELGNGDVVVGAEFGCVWRWSLRSGRGCGD